MTTIRSRLAVAAAALLALGGCVTFPSGPSVMALPGSQMSFDQFRADDYACRSYASQSIGGQDAQQAALDSGVTSAVVGTAIGAIAGAAIGGNSRGAAVGAGTGLLFGSAAGTGAADTSGRSLQHRYDSGYIQCMYAKGHKVPVAGRYSSGARSDPPPPRGSYAPPPPPGGSYAPPPAPGTYAPPPPAGAYAPPPPPER